MKSIFIIGYVWPEPTASAAGIRMLQLIRYFREQDYQVYFGTPAQRGPHGFDLTKMGVHIHDIEVNDDEFNTLIKGLNPDIVLFDRYMMEEQFSWRVAEHAPRALRVLNTEDLHFLRKYRERLKTKDMGEDVGAMMKTSLTRRELASIYRSDLSLIISEAELTLLTQEFGVPASILVYHPLFTEDSSTSGRGAHAGFGERKDLMMIGNFLHAPNADAVNILENGLWQAISRELPGVQLHIYGAYMPEAMQKTAASRNGMLYHGRAADVDTVMQQARLCIAPLRFGAGIKGKLLKAMENGLPSVTTLVGAEGIAGNLPWGGEIASLSEPFVKAVVRLYTDTSLWEEAVSNGYSIIDNRFTRKPFEEKLTGRINAVLLDTALHRMRNFTGQMLLDQRSMAARYLSKYIMAKNKK